MSRYFVTVLFFFQYCNKILFTRKNLSLFEQGTMSTVISKDLQEMAKHVVVGYGVRMLFLPLLNNFRILFCKCNNNISK